MGKIAFNASVFDGAPLYASIISTSVTVIDKTTATLANLWGDRDGLIVKANPFTLDEPGVIEFYADSGRYDITAVNGSNIRTWSDFLLIDPDGGVAPPSDSSTGLEFATVSNMIAGTAQNYPLTIDFADYIGRKVSTVYNNATSKADGAEYIVKTLVQAAIDGDVIDGIGSIGGNHACADGVHCVVLDVSNGINAGAFGPLVNNTDCIPTINACLQYAKNKVVDGVYTPTVTVPFFGTALISSVSVLFPRNVIVDLGRNRYKLADGASKYVFSQDDLTTDDFIGGVGGTLEYYNFTLDGNARGGQTRNLVGADARDMYCGFGALNFGLRSLKIHNYKCIDTEAWGFAYFKCRDVESHTGTFDQDQTRIGFNGDGITGQASRVHLWNLDGYTNDDFCAVTTTRASIAGIQIWNDPIAIDSFNVHDIELVDKAGKSPHFACGAYPSDGMAIKQWTMSDIQGDCENGLWRAGNYFGSLGGTNSNITNIVERNINGHSKTLNHGQRLLFEVSCAVYTCSESVNINSTIAANNQFLKLDTAVLSTLNINNVLYQQTFTPGSRQGVIYVGVGSQIKNVSASNFFHSLTGSQLATPERFTFIEVLGSRPRLSFSAVTKGDAPDGNLNLLKDDYWVSGVGVIAGDLNISFTEELTLNSGNYSAVDTLSAHYQSGLVTLRGTLESGGTVTSPSEFGVISRPAWAKPKASDLTSTTIFSKAGGAASPEAGTWVIRNGANTLDLLNISGNPTDSFVSLPSVTYECDPAMP